MNRAVSLPPVLGASLGSAAKGAPEIAIESLANPITPLPGSPVIVVHLIDGERRFTVEVDTTGMTTHIEQVLSYGRAREVAGGKLRTRLRAAAFRILASVVRECGADGLLEDGVAP